MERMSFSILFSNSATLSGEPNSIKSSDASSSISPVRVFHLLKASFKSWLSFTFWLVCSLTLKENALPFPFSLFTCTVPFIISTSCFVMERPRPVPPKRLVMEASAWLKLSKRESCCSFVIPIPVSFTIKNNSISSFTCMVLLISTLICPISVNFTALERRLFKICPILRPSPIINWGMLSSTYTLKFNSFLLISVMWVANTWSINL